MHKGSCLCGKVKLEVQGELRPPDACHCVQCRKQSGHYFVSTNVQRSDLKIHGSDNISWYQSSEKVRRGFCSTCGSFLFWDPIFQKEWTSLAMGVFDTPTHTKTEFHIFVADKGDYYEISDGLPQHAKFPPRP